MSGDFADLVIVSRARQLRAEKLVSFDRKLQKKFPGYVVESLEAI
jgi:predicted nucleic-acid-binding protein